MAILILLVLILAMAGGSGANWCVCRSDLNDATLQKTLDYACGAGADCGPIHQNGVCYNPNTVKAHCSYAVNSYFQKKGQAQGTCDFSATATPVTTDPSTGAGCVYPASQSAAGTTTTPSTSTTNPGTTTPSTSLTPTTTGTPTTVVGGGIGSGLGPTSINTDFNGVFLLKAGLGSVFLSFLFSSVVMFWV